MGCCQTLKIVGITNKDPLASSLRHKISIHDKSRESLDSLGGPEEVYTTYDKRPTSLSFRVRKASFIKKRAAALIDEFEIIERIGSGGYGTVYKVQDKATGLLRAVKSIDRSKMITEHILTEIENLIHVDHPNIVRILEFIEEPQTYYIITELCTGSNLIERITNSEDFTENQAAKYMQQIFSGLSHCHKLGIVHRDIKPENLLFEYPGENSLLKIIDFGHSSKMVENQKFTELLGTPYFVAPEVLDKNYDEKCDLWSCGVVLFIILIGYPPFNARNIKDLFRRIRRGKFKINTEEWRSISTEAQDLILNLLKLNVSERFTAEQAMNHKWIQQRACGAIKDRPLHISCLARLKSFHANVKLKQATLAFIATHLSACEETQQLEEVFRNIDKDGDGKISKEELEAGIAKVKLGSILDAREVMERCDIDQNGYIDFSEFITAATDWERSLSITKLERAFKAYDVDSSGTISAKELQNFLSADPSINFQECQNILKEVDTNGDGVIDFAEFIAIMRNKAF
ncbi:unnamed protein product [Blepharisma stoltei]|uniref:non-specific serine/threonine protein kinase n=1 Tax=Blepharisma stoltei TaxID=1481888 RepID=A0AAU9IZ48_9CILI|nr:unnamed protein product [Blepharisma stoltei]